MRARSANPDTGSVHGCTKVQVLHAGLGSAAVVVQYLVQLLLISIRSNAIHRTSGYKFNSFKRVGYAYTSGNVDCLGVKHHQLVPC
jgi:phosphomevalonate kinase